jgi:hypothetical protein
MQYIMGSPSLEAYKKFFECMKELESRSIKRLQDICPEDLKGILIGPVYDSIGMTVTFAARIDTVKIRLMPDQIFMTDEEWTAHLEKEKSK